MAYKVEAKCAGCGDHYTEDADLHRRLVEEFGKKVVCQGCRLEISTGHRDKQTLKVKTRDDADCGCLGLSHKESCPEWQLPL